MDADTLRRRISELATLDDNYDGDGADAPNGTAIASALSILSILDATAIVPDDVGADAMGGVTFDYCEPCHDETRTDKRAFVECSNFGHVLVVLESRVEPKLLHCSKVEMADMPDTAAKLRDFLER